jgi:hypothetical protein
MATQTQRRSALTSTLQQFAKGTAAEFVSAQIQSFAAAGSLDADKDYAACNANAAPFNLTLPGGASVYVGKEYTVKEWEGTNDVTIVTPGAGLIDGSATLVLAAGEAVTLVARAVDATTLDVTWDIQSQTAPNPAAGGELLAANNLSDVSDAATARANIVANRKTVLFSRVDLVGATAAVYRYVNVSGFSETVLKLGSAITGALTTGDATITASIDGTPITDGVITITQVGSAAGDVDTATPSALNVIADGSVLELTVGGTNDAAQFAEVSADLSY